MNKGIGSAWMRLSLAFKEEALENLNIFSLIQVVSKPFRGHAKSRCAMQVPSLPLCALTQSFD